MATTDQLTPIPNTTLSRFELAGLEKSLDAELPPDMSMFLATFGYASFIDVGYGEIPIGPNRAAFGQFYGKRPGRDFDPHDFASGGLRIGDAKSHFPPSSLIFAGDELGGEYFLKLGPDNPGIYWMIYTDDTDAIWVCENFSSFMAMIEVVPYDD